MTDRNLPNDFARCADGQYGCPRVETCARMIKPPNVPLAAFVDFWVATSFMGDDECKYYIKRDALLAKLERLRAQVARACVRDVE